MLTVQSGQVRGTSPDGQDTVTDEIATKGFKPGTVAHLAISSWSFRWTSNQPDTLAQLGLWLQKVKPTHGKPGGDKYAGFFPWVWSNDVDVYDDGSILARFFVFAGCGDKNNPFEVLINYLVIGEAP